MEDCRLILGDSLAVLPTLEAGLVDAVVTDPPYCLGEPRAVDGFGSMQRRGGVRTEDEKARRRGGFMGKKWDNDVAFRPETWAAVLRVAKPAAYLLAFGGTRTFHRLACAIEDAGWELRDTLCWLYAQGMPKSRGTLKPSWEPVLLARKPGPKVLPLNVDECRVPCEPIRTIQGQSARQQNGEMYSGRDGREKTVFESHPAGRWPANVAHDGSEEVMEAFAAFGEKASGKPGRNGHVRKAPRRNRDATWRFDQSSAGGVLYGDTGSAARFFFCGKASRAERGEGNTHNTVKPLSLMEWLCRLVTPPGGIILDPFAGSATTGVAALKTGRRFVGIEKEAEYVAIAQKRLAEAQGPLFATAGGGP